MSNSESNTENITEKNIDFGFVLAEARKSQNYSIDDICEYLKIPKNVISAIEASDITALPAPTFTQGYIRAYARFLEIAEEKLLEMYNQAVPHDLATDLKPRSSLPDEASSQSPVVKMVTMLLIAGGIAAVLFGSFQYYQKKADVMESEIGSKERSYTGSSLDSPTSKRMEIMQDTAISEDDGSITEASGLYGDVAEQEAELQVEDSGLSEKTTAAVVAEEEPAIMQEDVIEIIAEKGSWVEVRDATSARLLYNMIPSGESKVLQGKAPFRISMGNAKSTRVVINDVDIDMSGYIRSNNTASFTVSNEGQNIIFH